MQPLRRQYAAVTQLVTRLSPNLLNVLLTALLPFEDVNSCLNESRRR